MEIQEITAYKIDGSIFHNREDAERYKYAKSKIEVGDRVCTNRAVGYDRRSGGLPVPIFAYGLVEEVWELKEYVKLLKKRKVCFTESIYHAEPQERMVFFRNPEEKYLQWIKSEKELHKI